MSAGRSHLLLVNPSAGGGRVRHLLPEVEATLQARGVDHRTVLTENIEHALGEARIASQAGQAVVVMSGDELNGRRFLCIASCGFDSDCNRIANETRFIKGNLVYLYAVLRAMAAWKPARFTVVLDGDSHEFTGYSVAAANGKAYGGGMFFAP